MITLPALQGNLNEYKLSLSSPKNLIRIQREYTSQLARSPDNEKHLPAWLLNDTISYEWIRTYTSEDYSYELFENLPIGYYWEGWLSTPILIDILGDYVVDHLNQEAITLLHDEYITLLPAAIGVNPYQMEIDGDSNPEWLVSVKDDHRIGKYTIWLTLDQDENGDFTRIENQLPPFYGFPRIENPAYQLRDINGDGVMDAAITENWCGFGDCGSILHVAKGGSDGFTNLPSSASARDDAGSEMTQSYTFEWSISPVNNLPVLEIKTFRDLAPWDCTVLLKEEYQWIGDNEHLTKYPLTYLDTATCVIARAMDKEEPLDIQRQIQLLNIAYNHADGLSNEYQVFVLYRLALLHTLEGEDWAARKYIDLISEIADEGATPIAEALMGEILPLLDENLVYPYKLCLAAESILRIDEETPWRVFIGHSSFPYEGFPDGYPSQLCNSRDIHEDVLIMLNIDFMDSPEDVLFEAGVPSIFVTTFEIPNQDPVLIFALEEFDSDNLFANGSEMEGEVHLYGYTEDHGWFHLDLIKYPLDRLLVITEDVTGDGESDLIITIPQEKDKTCMQDEVSYEVEMITTLTNGRLLSLTWYYNFCYPEGGPFRPGMLLEDNNQDGISDWIFDTLIENDNDPTLLSEILPENHWLIHGGYIWPGRLPIYKPGILDDINTLFFESTNRAEMREEIISYRDRWGSDDELGQNIRAQLDYLLALSYELEGNEEKAVEIFYRIWKDQAETFWAHLAASRLEYLP